MAYLIGTDEAGYAPNLGPLVITCTVWRVAQGPPDLDLYRRLQAVVCPDLDADEGGPLLVADSKVVYSPARGLRLLERGVLAMVGMVDDVPRDWRAAWQTLDSEAAAHLDHLPWHRDYDAALPHTADRDDVLDATGRLREGLAAAGVELVSVRSTAVFPELFNDGADRWGNKAEALSRWTLALVAEALGQCDGEEVRVVCDKHGGRNRYGRLLQESFPEHLIEVRARKSCREHLSLGFQAAANRSPLLYRRRVVLARGAGLDGLEILARVGDAGVQRLLVSASSQPASHGRLSR